MKGYRVIGTEKLNRKRNRTVIYTGKIMETAKQCFDEIKQLVKSDINSMNTCEVHALFIAGNACWRDSKRMVNYSVRLVNDDGSYCDMIDMDM